MTTKQTDLAKSTNFDELLRSDEPIFIKNTTTPRGILVIDFSHPATGTNMSYKIQKTWVPLEITAAIPKKVLEDNMDFRAYILKGILTIIPRTEAEKVLATKDAKEELKRINSSKYAGIDKSGKKDEIITKDINLKGREGQIRPQVRSLILDLEDGLADEAKSKEDKAELKSKTLSSLKTISDELSANDWGYVLKEVHSKKIRKFAKAKLSEIDAGDNDNDDDN